MSPNAQNLVIDLIIEALGRSKTKPLPPAIEDKLAKMRERMACRFGMEDANNELQKQGRAA